ncbi:MAG: SCP2 sterol-binding domain-containing protein [Eubacterium sp.]|nr:SCP2 sterol-binding domain-containing protein [Eubacterium sp.]
MKVNIYYGGRGVLDDPTLYVIEKIQSVLQELNVKVTRYNLYEMKNEITALPSTLKNADAIILATTIEWIGIGGYMQQFLDSCWLYGDKEKIGNLYMQPVVMSTTYGEKEGMLTLQNAWELLGGLPCEGVCGYVEDLLAFEMKNEYTKIIEKKAETLYRTISQKLLALPSSNQAVKKSVLRTNQMQLTPQESEQLSQYVSNDDYVKKQKEDIEELKGLFSELLKEEKSSEDEYIPLFTKAFKPQPNFEALYEFIIEGKSVPLILDVTEEALKCRYEKIDEPDVLAKLDRKTLNDILEGNQTFQKAFMTGDMTAKGNFRTLQMLDNIFEF